MPNLNGCVLDSKHPFDLLQSAWIQGTYGPNPHLTLPFISRPSSHQPYCSIASSTNVKSHRAMAAGGPNHACVSMNGLNMQPSGIVTCTCHILHRLKPKVFGQLWPLLGKRWWQQSGNSRVAGVVEPASTATGNRLTVEVYVEWTQDCLHLSCNFRKQSYLMSPRWGSSCPCSTGKHRQSSRGQQRWCTREANESNFKKWESIFARSNTKSIKQGGSFGTTKNTPIFSVQLHIINTVLFKSPNILFCFVFVDRKKTVNREGEAINLGGRFVASSHRTALKPSCGTLPTRYYFVHVTWLNISVESVITIFFWTKRASYNFGLLFCFKQEHNQEKREKVVHEDNQHSMLPCF